MGAGWLGWLWVSVGHCGRRPGGFWAPFLLEAGGAKAADGRPFLVVMSSLAMDAVCGPVAACLRVTAVGYVRGRVGEAEAGEDRLGVLRLEPGGLCLF